LLLSLASSGGAPASVALVARRAVAELLDLEHREAARGVAGVSEHAPDVDDGLDVDVLAVRWVEHLGLRAHADLELPVVLPRHGADRLEEGLDLAPLEVPPVVVLLHLL
jgi:hypothetical protein